MESNRFFFKNLQKFPKGFLNESRNSFFFFNYCILYITSEIPQRPLPKFLQSQRISTNFSPGIPLWILKKDLSRIFRLFTNIPNQFCPKIPFKESPRFFQDSLRCLWKKCLNLSEKPSSKVFQYDSLGKKTRILQKFILDVLQNFAKNVKIYKLLWEFPQKFAYAC